MELGAPKSLKIIKIINKLRKIGNGLLPFEQILMFRIKKRCEFKL